MGAIDDIKVLKELLDAGILTQEEYDAKKREILDLKPVETEAIKGDFAVGSPSAAPPAGANPVETALGKAASQQLTHDETKKGEDAEAAQPVFESAESESLGASVSSAVSSAEKPAKRKSKRALIAAGSVALALIVVYFGVLAVNDLGSSGEESVASSAAPSPESNDDDGASLQLPTDLGTIEELEKEIRADVDATVAALSSDYEALVASVDTYQKYAQGDEVSTFYAKVLEENERLCARMYVYALRYAEIVMASDISDGAKYDDFDGFLDVVYDEAGDNILDGIYDGVLSDMYDAYYNGIIADESESMGSGELHEARSVTYEDWSNARSDVYETWSDMRSEIYDFWSDMRGELWDGDGDRAEARLEKFREEFGGLDVG